MHSNFFLNQSFQHVPHIHCPTLVSHQEILVVLCPAKTSDWHRHFPLEYHHSRLDVDDVEHSILTAAYNQRTIAVEPHHAHGLLVLENEFVLLRVDVWQTLARLFPCYLEVPEKQFTAGSADRHPQGTIRLKCVQTHDFVLQWKVTDDGINVEVVPNPAKNDVVFR